MDPTVAAIVVICIFALIIIAAFLVFRQRGKVKIKGPFGTGLDLDASSESTPAPPSPGVLVEGAKSRGGGILAEDDTGRGAHVKDVEVQNDILVSSTSPQEEDTPKKTDPPA